MISAILCLRNRCYRQSSKTRNLVQLTDQAKDSYRPSFKINVFLAIRAHTILTRELGLDRHCEPQRLACQRSGKVG